MDLNYFAIKNKTDKSSLIHNYCDDYQEAIERYLSKSKVASLSVLEIGVNNGASLRMWSDYFISLHVNHRIVGVDINPEAKKSENQQRLISVEIGDQSDAAFLERVIAQHGPFDLVIDDGSHLSHHQQASFFFLFPHVKSGGIYIVEDVCTSYWNGYTNPGETTMVNFCKSLIDDVNFRGFAPEGKVDRNEKRLIEHAKKQGLEINTSIRSIHFFNSTIIIYRR